MSGSCYSRAPVDHHQSPHLLSAFPDVNYSDHPLFVAPTSVGLAVGTDS